MSEHRGLDLVALQKFLSDSNVPLNGELRADLISGGKSNLTYAILDDSSRWVLRRPPTAGLTPSAHDVAREFRITSALQGTDVPVAATVALCEDDSVMGAPFTVVEHVTGQVIRTKPELDALSDADIDACTDELVRVLGALHNVDYDAVGLGELGRPDGYVARQVKLWASQWARVKTTDSADVDRLHAALAESIPQQSESSIVHGDYRIDNTILAPGDVSTVAAVVDWELSTLGDPLTDVALMCVYRHPALDLVLGEPAAWTSPRLPSADDLAQRYTLASGRDLVHWNFYLALANFKLAVIAEGINHRYRAGATVGDGFDKAGDAVPEFIAAGLRALKGQTV
ncbi:phosphotransferase family protein [Rhodococcus sp. NPDC057014]|uniref:phosphotransferase family protein n=1 Tax=Rhodococcus sp. NPDC057014 TaxID=3346000 RepID=UPI0036411D54